MSNFLSTPIARRVDGSGGPVDTKNPGGAPRGFACSMTGARQSARHSIGNGDRSPLGRVGLDD